MLSLIYVSTASAPLSLAQVEAMADRAALRNAESGITGMLTFNGAGFMQLLEGEEGKVLTTMYRIEHDRRHGQIEYIRQETRGHRECPGWAMRAQIAPLVGHGSAMRFGRSLPDSLSWDTRMLFTSFASSMREAIAPITARQPNAGPVLQMAVPA